MIIVVGNTKGGVGKSTIAAQLSGALSADGADVVLVDTDPGRRSSASWAQVRVEDSDSGKKYVPCFEITGNLKPALIDLQQRYQFVVVDVGGKDSQELRTALLAADMLVMPIKPSAYDMWGIDEMRKMLEATLDYNPSLAGLAVVNEAPTDPRSDEAAEAREYLEDSGIDLPIAKTIIRVRRAYRRSAAQGAWAGDVQPADRKARHEIEQVYQEVLDVAQQDPA